MIHSRKSLTLLAAAVMALLPGCGHAPAPVAAPVTPPATTAGPTPGAPSNPSTPSSPSTTSGWQTGVTGIPITLGSSRGSFLALVSEQAQPDQLKVSLTAAGNPLAYHTASTAGAPDPELAFRALDRKLDGLKAAHRFRVQAAAPRRAGDTDRFWVIASSNGADVVDRQVTARTVYAGAHCDVLVDQADGTAIDAAARAMGAEFDQKIYATDTRLFGEPLPVGARGDRVTIVVSPEVGNHGKDTTLGYFTARDLFAPADMPNEPFLQHSNQGAILYLSDRVVGRGLPADYFGTLAHEFQHLISGTYKLYGKAQTQEALWLNESMSMYAMVANGYGLADGSRVIASHVGNFLANPAGYSLTRWDLNPEQSAYGAGYLFMTYVVERVGEDALKALVASPQTGVENMDAVLAPKGLSFKQLFRDWVAATMLDGTGAGAPYEYRTLDLHGTYAGRTFKGPAMAAVDLPNSGSVPVLPYSASYLLLRGAPGSTFQLDVAGRSPDALGAFVQPR